MWKKVLSESLRVVVVLSHYEQSGLTTNTIDLCEGLKNIGHRVTLIVGRALTSQEEERSIYAQSKGFEIKEIPNPNNGLAERIKTYLALSKELLTGGYDMIHMESIYLSIIPKLLHMRFTVTLHSWGLAKNIFAPRATRIIAISEGIKEEALNRHGYQEDQIDVVLHGVSKRFGDAYTDEEKLSIRARLGIPTDKLVIGIVSSIEPRKGHHFLLEAIAMLPTELRNQVHIVICGNYRVKENEQWIHSLIDKFRLNSKVSILGFRDPLHVYRALDIFVLPSVWEGFGLTPIEAMMSNCCVVRSNVQGAKEQIINGETGFVFESENSKNLSEVLNKLITDTQIIKNVARAGREYALTHFTLDTMARNTANVYRKILDRN